MVIDDERGVINRGEKRLREEDDSELTTDISQVEEDQDEIDSQSDGSVRVISERGRVVGDVGEDDDDDYDYLMQALNEAKEEQEVGDSKRSSEETTDVESKGSSALKPRTMGGQSSEMEPIDLEAEIEEQQAVEEITDEPEPSSATKVYKAVRDYQCPICLEPPENASIAPCGHIFCVACLFRMVNNSRGQRKTGLCALCRKEIQFRQVKIVILRKKRVRKGS
ncbi:hypothetical protein HG536_0B04460 [Torulaspora globosa]|uniref:RING-type domain-containing protein n=1 Tax=Torulaspora globosa TaxID=48254 RepID=A0A7G3ZDJ6_9SACH|nr:uncharacterized protein HG536_0B04460 [Torulaspora globosa]QLL31582.1 hypothetical protein HG536_0B04460 [Torulaspora globosa]